jgi:hypothetical protein
LPGSIAISSSGASSAQYTVRIGDILRPRRAAMSKVETANSDPEMNTEIAQAD